MHNPYENVNWNSINQIMCTTHDHVLDASGATVPKQNFLNLYNGGVRCFAISNYYPSAPMYPLSDFEEELDNVEIPSDIIEIPNAEHHNFSFHGSFGNQLHMNAIGSMFESGKPRGEEPIGYNGTAKAFIAQALYQLKYSDGGGISLNHPTWTKSRSRFDDEWFMELLDMDDRVLGIEIFNNNDYDTVLWDKILNTARRCFGFAVPDHQHKTNPNWGGRIMILVPYNTEYECLKSIRDGAFYAKIYNTDLEFNRIEINNGMFEIETSKPTTIKFIADGAIVQQNSGVTSSSYSLANINTYIRAEAETEDDLIFTNPIMIRIEKHMKHLSGKTISSIYSL